MESGNIYSSESNIFPLYRPEHPLTPICNCLLYGLVITISCASLIISLIFPTWPPKSLHWTIIMCGSVNLTFGCLSATMACWYREGNLLPRVKTFSYIMLALVLITSISIILHCCLISRA